MRRSPFCVLLLSAFVAAPALAQSTPSAAPTPTANAPAAGSTPAATASAEAKKPEEKKDAPQQNARLAPGGVVGGGNRFPLRLTAVLDNFVGNGLLAPGYQRQPNFGTSLTLRPSAALPKLDWAPRMIAAMSVDFSVANWLPAATNFASVYDRQVRVSDPALALILPAVFTEEFTKISVSPVLSVRLPLSITSRQQNLIVNAGGSAQMMWMSPETPVGGFFVQYTPGARVSAFSEVGPTMPCDAPAQYGLPLPSGDPVNGLDDLPLVMARTTEVLPNGECIISGRQTVASISNSVAGGWNTNDGTHNVTLSLGVAHGLLRSLATNDALHSPFSSGQNFIETSSGSLSYTYTVPVDFQMFLTAGLASQQPAFTAAGDLRFPLYDFFTPANNFSAAFFDVTVGI